ncbi:hypothetical protein CDAR_66171 [Caerostris darwini]|uniref:Uncharacterized protein n=1 Tax=Caerostris darwini TaxID=1538125 RepID=A0AAV4VWW4_9ARAC|nr:hypothetical protein CDAR_66171 [Caerostris darwini]
MRHSERTGCPLATPMQMSCRHTMSWAMRFTRLFSLSFSPVRMQLGECYLWRSSNSCFVRASSRALDPFSKWTSLIPAHRHPSELCLSLLGFVWVAVEKENELGFCSFLSVNAIYITGGLTSS